MKIVTQNVVNNGNNELDITFSLQEFKSADKVAQVFSELKPLVDSKQKITVTQLLMIVAGLLLD